jgi:rubrerythrin
MGTVFNAAEIFETALEIERNGRAFYLRAASMVKSEKPAGILRKLADMEARHAEIVEAMRLELFPNEEDSPLQDFDCVPETYLRESADSKIFTEIGSALNVPSGDVPPTKIFSMAIDFERESIRFFTGMRDLVPVELGKDKIDLLIKEEMNHLTILTAEKERLSEPQQDGEKNG